MIRKEISNILRLTLALIPLLALAGLVACAADDMANVTIKEKANVTFSGYLNNSTKWNYWHSISQVKPGNIHYLIRVTNNDTEDYAIGLVVTDKLAPELINVKVNQTGNSTESPKWRKSGDVVYIYPRDLPPLTSEYIVINATIPQNASPNTIYNSVNIRSTNDNNSMDNMAGAVVYTPPMSLNGTIPQYSVVNATESFSELIEDQAGLLFSFEDLLHEVPRTTIEKYEFIASFENLLRMQTYLYDSLADLLTNSTESGWNTNITGVDQDRLLNRYENLIRKESFLFMSFDYAIKEAFSNTAPGEGIGPTYHYSDHTLYARQEFTASFEDLLKRQVSLLHTFQLLQKRKDDTGHSARVAFLSSFEDLLRLESNLLLSFEDVIKDYTFDYISPSPFMPPKPTETPAMAPAEGQMAPPGEVAEVATETNATTAI